MGEPKRKFYHFLALCQVTLSVGDETGPKDISPYLYLGLLDSLVPIQKFL